VPFMPVPGHVGSDYERLRPDFRVIDDPFHPGRRVMLVPAIRPDVALLHAVAAAPDGTLLLDLFEDDALLAQASCRVLATAERITTADELRRAGTGPVLEGVHVSAVVEAPGAARPTLVRGAYEVDAGAVARYVEAARDEVTFKTWLAEHVYD